MKEKIKSLEDEVMEKTKRVKELEEELITTTLEHAINDVLSDFELVSDTAEEIARSIVEKSISIDEDGSVQGVGLWVWLVGCVDRFAVLLVDRFTG